MTDPAAIAGRLTPAQKRALLSASTTHYRKLAPWASRALGTDLRWRLLARDGSDYTISDLGLAVRAELARSASAQPAWRVEVVFAGHVLNAAGPVETDVAPPKERGDG